MSKPSRYLDTKITGLAAERLVVRLLTILERGFSGKLGMLSNKPEGTPDVTFRLLRSVSARLRLHRAALMFFLRKFNVVITRPSGFSPLRPWHESQRFTEN